MLLIFELLTPWHICVSSREQNPLLCRKKYNIMKEKKNVKIYSLKLLQQAEISFTEYFPIQSNAYRKHIHKNEHLKWLSKDEGQHILSFWMFSMKNRHNEKKKKKKLLAYISHHLGFSSFSFKIFHLRLQIHDVLSKCCFYLFLC